VHRPRLPPHAIVTADAGSFAAPIYRIVPFRRPQAAGADRRRDGFGVPAAVAAALREPPAGHLLRRRRRLFDDRQRAGGRQERGATLKVIVSENRLYGSIWIHQQRSYPGRTTGTHFAIPIFR